MKKTKLMSAGFAIFASMIMLMMSCMSAPVSEKIVMNTVEDAKRSLLDSVETLLLKIENDRNLKYFAEEFSSDKDLSRISNCIQRTVDKDKLSYMTADYFDVLKNKEVFSDFEIYFERAYSKDILNIDNQFSIISNKLADDRNSDSVDEEILSVAGVWRGANYQVDSFDGATEISGCSTQMGSPDYMISDSGVISILVDMQDMLGNTNHLNDLDEVDVEGDQAGWIGYLRDSDDCILVPGYGWISSEDDEYDDWLDFESMLIDLGLTSDEALEAVDMAVEMGLQTSGFWSWIWDWIWAIINPILWGKLIKWVIKKVILSILFGWLDLLGDFLEFILAYADFLANWPPW